MGDGKWGERASDLVEGEDPVELLAGDGLRDRDLPLVVVAGDDLRRVAPELVVAEGPAARTRAVSAADLRQGGLTLHPRTDREGPREREGEGNGVYLQRRRTCTFTAFSLSCRDDMANAAAKGGGGSESEERRFQNLYGEVGRSGGWGGGDGEFEFWGRCGSRVGFMRPRPAVTAVGSKRSRWSV